MSVPYLSGDFVVIQQMCVVLFKRTRQRPDQILRCSRAAEGLRCGNESWTLGVGGLSLLDQAQFSIWDPRGVCAQLLLLLTVELMEDMSLFQVIYILTASWRHFFPQISEVWTWRDLGHFNWLVERLFGTEMPTKIKLYILSPCLVSNIPAHLLPSSDPSGSPVRGRENAPCLFTDEMTPHWIRKEGGFWRSWVFTYWTVHHYH